MDLLTALTSTRGRWYNDLLKYNCGDIDKDQLLEAANGSRYNRCEAYFLIGLKELSQGHRDDAKAAFQQGKETRVWHWAEYSWSRAFLARMEADRNWPPWIEPLPSEDSEALDQAR